MKSYSVGFLLFMLVGFFVLGIVDIVELVIAAINSKDDNISYLVVAMISSFYFSKLHLDALIAKEELSRHQEESEVM